MFINHPTAEIYRSFELRRNRRSIDNISKKASEEAQASEVQIPDAQSDPAS